MKNLILLFLVTNFVLLIIIFSFSLKNRVVFFDVGQGSSVLIQNGKNTILYDTGRSGYKVLQGLRNTLPFFQKRIDLLIISHADQDHYQGAFDIFDRYKVRYLIASRNFSDSSFQKLLKIAKEKGTEVLFLSQNDEILTNDLQILVLHPSLSFTGKDNDFSLVMKVQGRNNSFLLTGDIEKRAIQALIDCCRLFLKSNIFLWPHHGSKYSLDYDFLQSVLPQKVIIQVGSNDYGHPHQEVIRFLNSLRMPVFRTDLNGQLEFSL